MVTIRMRWALTSARLVTALVLGGLLFGPGPRARADEPAPPGPRPGAEAVAIDGPPPEPRGRGIAEGGCYRPGPGSSPQAPGGPVATPASPSTPIDVTQDPAAHAKAISGHAEYLPPSALPPAKGASPPVLVKVLARSVTQAPIAALAAGDVVTFTHRGGMWSVDERTIPVVGPLGHVKERALHTNWGDRREVATLPFGRLLARVGHGPWLDAGGGAPVRTLAAGPLEMRINDGSDSLADNAGALDVEVTVFRGAAPVALPSPSAP